jgi:hypothetical protein
MEMTVTVRVTGRFALLLASLASPGLASGQEIAIKGLPALLPWPDSGKDSYRVDPYITTTGKLNAVGKDEAVKLLRAAAVKDSMSPPDPVIHLCRMLFTPKKGKEFRPPMLGAPHCLGGSDRKDWSRLPIEIVDGVPFLILSGYTLGGAPEATVKYVDYCSKECEWGGTDYPPKSDAEKKAALEKLLASKKWKRPLEKSEREFLASQIK